MRHLRIIALVLIGVGCMNGPAWSAPSAACKQCGDYRSRCMKNYPGPTCKTDYDICMKTCAKK